MRFTKTAKIIKKTKDLRLVYSQGEEIWPSSLEKKIELNRGFWIGNDSKTWWVGIDKKEALAQLYAEQESLSVD